MVAAYFEAGPYWEFNLLQKEIIKALQQRGVAARIVFPDDLHISPGWDAPNSVYRAEARKLMSNPAIDVIISMGQTQDDKERCILFERQCIDYTLDMFWRGSARYTQQTYRLNQ